MGSQKSLDDLSIDDDRAIKFVALVSGRRKTAPQRPGSNRYCVRNERKGLTCGCVHEGQSLSLNSVDDKGMVEVKPLWSTYVRRGSEVTFCM
jgi:hypothetical protein